MKYECVSNYADSPPYVLLLELFIEKYVRMPAAQCSLPEGHSQLHGDEGAEM